MNILDFKISAPSHNSLLQPDLQRLLPDKNIFHLLSCPGQLKMLPEPKKPSLTCIKMLPERRQEPRQQLADWKLGLHQPRSQHEPGLRRECDPISRSYRSISSSAYMFVEGDLYLPLSLVDELSLLCLGLEDCGLFSTLCHVDLCRPA